jgi:hypothetical protein
MVKYLLWRGGNSRGSHSHCHEQSMLVVPGPHRFEYEALPAIKRRIPRYTAVDWRWRMCFVLVVVMNCRTLPTFACSAESRRRQMLQQVGKT